MPVKTHEPKNLGVLMIDFCPVVREGLQAILTKDERIEVIGDAPDEHEALQHIKRAFNRGRTVHVVLTETRSGKVDGVQATKLIKEQFPEVAVLVLTENLNDAYVIDAIHAGAVGYIFLKDMSPEMLLQSIHRAVEGGMQMSATVLRLIDKDTFRQVQSVMSNNAPKAVHPRIVPSFYLLSGILVCSCGSAMVGRSAKSHRYYYYTCNRNCKQGREACNSRILPKEKIERLVVDQIESKILDLECLEPLVVLVNADLDAGHSAVKEKMANIDIELHESENRLTSLYDALETGKLALDDLAPRIKELRTKQNELSKTRLVAEAEMTLQGYQQLDIDAVRAYAADLWNILEESEVAQRKAFLRSFVKKIVVDKETVRLYYNLPVPPDGIKMDTIGVLPIDTPSGLSGSIAKPRIETFFELTLA